MRKLLIAILLVVLVGAFAAAAFLSYRDRPAPSFKAAQADLGGDLAASLAAIEAQERHTAETLWAPEMLAQECGRTFEVLWDSINRATNKLEAAATFSFDAVVPGNWAESESLPHQIVVQRSSAPGARMDLNQWRDRLVHFHEAGWLLEQIEFRHNRFETNSSGGPERSTFWFSAHLLNPELSSRAMIDGDLLVYWGARTNDHGLFPVKQIDASALVLKTRAGKPPFRRSFSERVEPLENADWIDPLIVRDLDGDGIAEIILVWRNLLYRRTGEGSYQSETFCRYPIDHIASAVIADFDGDGALDLLGAKYEGLFLSKGAADGTFSERPVRVWSGTPIREAMVLTCGDIDGDGDLDSFLGQYRDPYEGGVTPTPFYDANDGYPAFLFLNDGIGNFSDATISSGLGEKRNRRTYSASFVDLDHDGDLDLAVVSDFAGIDIYSNNGKGYFTDVTESWTPERYAFGMAHSIADLNSDGLLDIFMTGMTSPTVERLDHLGLWRSEEEKRLSMRSKMSYGNRLYLQRESGGFEQTALSDAIARSGWSWGCTSLDFDNDGLQDVYIANGMESNESVREYEHEAWLHDFHVGAGTNSTAQDIYFKSKFSRTRGRDYSYGGYEKNRLFWNRGGKSFLDIGYLMNVGLPEDSPNVVAEDLNGDGRVDLVVITSEFWPERKKTLFVYMNELAVENNWIAFRPEGSSIGTIVQIESGGRRQAKTVVTGDSYRSQHSGVLHFGIGKARQVDGVHITWPNGETESLGELGVNRLHHLQRNH